MNHATRTPRRRNARAFTIVEVIVIVLILGVIASIIAPRLFGRIGQSRQAVAQSNAASLANAMRMFMMDCGLPEPGASLDVLIERPPNVPADRWQGPYVDSRDALIDPWGNQYILVIPGDKNVDFDIVSFGADGKPGGSGEDADIIKP